MLLGPEFSPPVWRMPVLAFAAGVHLCHESRDQGEVQDPGECSGERSHWEECTGAAWCHVPVPAGQRVRGLDHRVLLLPSGCVSDDKRGEATAEDSDLSCDHDPGMLLKTQLEMEYETVDGGQVRY